MMEQFFEDVRVDGDVFGCGAVAVDDCGNLPVGAERLGAGRTGLGTRLD